MDRRIAAFMPCNVALVAHETLREITENYPHLARMLWLNTLVDERKDTSEAPHRRRPGRIRPEEAHGAGASPSPTPWVGHSASFGPPNWGEGPAREHCRSQVINRHMAQRCAETL